MATDTPALRKTSLLVICLHLPAPFGRYGNTVRYFFIRPMREPDSLGVFTRISVIVITAHDLPLRRTGFSSPYTLVTVYTRYEGFPCI